MGLPTPSEAKMKMFVRRSAKQLDAFYPNWYENIDLERLDMNLPDRCIVGQLGLLRVRNKIKDPYSNWLNLEMSTSRGFYWEDKSPELKVLWVNEITKRLG